MRRESALALIRHNVLLARRDLATVAFAVAMPLVLIAFTRTVYLPVLVGDGYPAANGTEQAVPRMASGRSCSRFSSCSRSPWRSR